ncbi:MAG: type V CRISPR-associated protein Cas12a/Cpf1 [Treponema sp.]|nr:type V CRISPR-associated protein Cas12a/Cpf1 [Treponema sp.]
MKIIDNYACSKNFNGFSVSKTIVNKLIPVGKTRESMNKYDIINSDIKRENDSLIIKKLIDKAHKNFISTVLESVNIDWNELYTVWNNSINEKNKALLKPVQEKYRKTISNCFKNTETFKKLFSKELFENILPGFASSEEEIKLLKDFAGFTSYFTNYNTIRKFIYTEEEKHNAVAFRIVNENFDIFVKNCNVILKNPEFFLNDDFRVMNEIVSEVNFPVSDKNINEYNILISGKYDGKICIAKGLNQLIKEYNDANKTNVPLLKKLYLNILSEKEPLFKVDFFDETADVIKAVHEYNSLFEPVFKKYVTLDMPSLDKVYIPFKKLNILSNLVTKDYSLYKNAVMTYSEEKQKEYYSFKELNDYYYQWVNDNSSVEESRDISSYFGYLLSYDFDKLYSKINFSEITNLQKNKEQVIPIKEYLQSVLDFYNLLRLVELPDDTDLDVDEKYYAFINDNKSFISEIVLLYNKTRNFVTKSFKEQKKIKLNFECVSLLAGWDINKEYTNNAVMFCDKETGKYYLGIFNSETAKPKFTQDAGSNFEKMYIKYIPSPNKMLPHIFFSAKGIKTFNPSEELLEKYKKGLYKKGENFDLDFCHELIDYFKNGIKNYENYNVFDFKFKETSEYNDISEFYKDVSDCGFKLQMLGINKKEVFDAVENEQLFLFEVYNRHLSGKSHGKDIHTEYFKALFDKDNDFIQLCGGAEIFYRPALAEKNITHKTGSYIVNRNTKSGLSIDSEVYKSIYNHLNFGKTLSADAKTLIDSGEVVYKKADRDLIKDRRYTEENITFHLPILLNYKARDVFVKSFNENVINTINNNDVNILAVNRGENNLITTVLIDKNGKILNKKSYNTIDTSYNKINFKDKLARKEQERMNSRMNWQEIENISKLKDGYLSVIVHEIATMMVENNAVLVMEDLSADFVHSRAMIERNVYQKFQSKLIEKLSFLVFKNAEKNENGSIYHPYQLCPDINEYKPNYLQFGWIFFLNPTYISKIISEESYVNVFNFYEVNNFKDRIKYLSKFKSIKKSKDGFEFYFERKLFNELFEGEDKLVCNGIWNIYNKKEKQFEKVDVSESLEKAFSLINCTEFDENYIPKINELSFSLINNSALEMILNCLKICSEKKQFINNEWQYKNESCDSIAAYNLALKMKYIISLGMNLGKYNSVQNIKTGDFVNYLDEKGIS